MIGFICLGLCFNYREANQYLHGKSISAVGTTTGAGGRRASGPTGWRWPGERGRGGVGGVRGGAGVGVGGVARAWSSSGAPSGSWRHYLLQCSSRQAAGIAGWMSSVGVQPPIAVVAVAGGRLSGLEEAHCCSRESVLVGSGVKVGQVNLYVHLYWLAVCVCVCVCKMCKRDSDESKYLYGRSRAPQT